MTDSESPKQGLGCFSKLMALFLLATLVGLLAAVYHAVTPQDLSDLGGRTAVAGANKARDLKVVLQNAIDRDFPLTLTETEINQWLADTLVMKQGGVLKDSTKLERVLVRLEDGRAEVIMLRSILGKPFTVSMYIQVERVESTKGVSTEIRLHGGPFLKDYENPTKGGRFGRLVMPQGYLHLVMPAYSKLADVFPEEIDLALTRMSKISIEKGRLTLDPRQMTGEPGMPGR